MGELEPWMDENFVKNVFTTVSGENVNVKVIRDRASGNAGYCFVEFNTVEAATKALNLTGSNIPNSTRAFKLNWASGGGLVDRRDDRSPEYSIFVGDLGPEVNEFVLVSLFQARFPSCKSAKIMTDAVTGQSRGYGFVRFSDENDQQRSLIEMQGVYCGNRPMRISTATPKTRYVVHALLNRLSGWLIFSLYMLLILSTAVPTSTVRASTAATTCTVLVPLRAATRWAAGTWATVAAMAATTSPTLVPWLPSL